MAGVFQDVFAQRMGEAVKEFAGDIRLGLGNEMLAAGAKIRPGRGVEVEGKGVAVKIGMVPEQIEGKRPKEATDAVKLFAGAVQLHFKRA